MLLKGQGNSPDTRQDGNRLIDSLPREQRAAVLALCERVELERGVILCEMGQPFAHAYFPLSGTLSLVRELTGHGPFESESIGREGMLGRALVLDINRSPQRCIVQTPCVALRMAVGTLREALQRHAELRLVLQRYLYAVLEELSQSKGCVHFHDVGKRLARVLLVARDRARTDNLSLTHQMLASMLGVRRGAVTIAAIKLQRDGIIRYSRGKIAILDHEALEAASCGCYSANLENQEETLA